MSLSQYLSRASALQPASSLEWHLYVQVVPFVPESKLLTELLELEHHIDTIYTRKHAELTTLPTVVCRLALSLSLSQAPTHWSITATASSILHR